MTDPTDFPTIDITDDARLQNDALQKMTDRIISRMRQERERQAVAAWMAGYTALDVLTPPMTLTHTEGYREAYFPTDIGEPPSGPPRWSLERWDLRALDDYPEAARAVRMRDHD